MREIKFRAWDKEEEKMWMPEDEGNEIGFIANFAKGTIDLWDIEQQRNIDCEIMQCTGLKDSYGTEIYEGDIIKHESEWDWVIGTVEWLNDFGCWYVCGIENGLGDLILNGELEVIGNIYENHEILEVKNEQKNNAVDNV